MIRGYCAMKPVEKIEEDGRKALAYNQATQMVWCTALETRNFT
jgi:hypothetical protein